MMCAEYEPAKHKEHGQGTSLKFRHGGHLTASITPGPGTYMPSLPDRHSSPAYSMHPARSAQATISAPARSPLLA